MAVIATSNSGRKITGAVLKAVTLVSAIKRWNKNWSGNKLYKEVVLEIFEIWRQTKSSIQRFQKSFEESMKNVFRLAVGLAINRHNV